MTAIAIFIGIGVAAVCAAAAHRIATAKGRSDDARGLSLLSFFVAPIGLAVAAFMRPDDPTRDRLEWWGDAPVARAWTVVATLLIAGVVVFDIHQATGPSHFSGNSLEPQIKHWLAQNGIPGASVQCPTSYKGEANYRFLCTATDTTGTAHIEVTVLNDKGEVEWRLLG